MRFRVCPQIIPAIRTLHFAGELRNNLGYFATIAVYFIIANSYNQ